MENVCGICHGEAESENENENNVVGVEESASRDVEDLLGIQIRHIE
jgi:hypothetical protein